MKDIRAALFDADGVLALPEELFSKIYAKSRALPEEPFQRFFKDTFSAALIGKADVKDLIAQNQDVWHWDGDLEDLLKLWCETENVTNKPLLNLVQEIRASGIPCYVATNNEKYRGQYIRDIMFKNKFDGYFISAELGAMKPDVKFFKLALSTIQQLNRNIRASNVLFIDDSKTNIEAAKQIGFNAHLYESVEHVAELLCMVQKARP